MSRLDEPGISSTAQGQIGDPWITPGQYGLPSKTTSQKLTPLDMNMPRLYGARWILCFPLSPSTNKNQVYEYLATGLAHTTNSIPWLSGNICLLTKGLEQGSDGTDNRIQIVNSSDGIKFPCTDLTGILPSYAELKKEGFPLSRLSTAQLGPIGVFPETLHPVMAVQANFIENGLLLTVGVHHSACDAAALDTIIGTWARNTAAASGSNSFTTYDAPSNDRSPLMEGTPGASIVDFPEYKLRASSDLKTQRMLFTPPQLPPMMLRVLQFSPESLADLKASAAAFSTHDALCAFLWRHMTLARRVPDGSPGSSTDEHTSALAFAVNIRDRASPPLLPTYLGNASMASVTDRLSIAAITAGGGLSQAAAAIRKSLGAFSAPSRVALTIGLLQSRSDPTEFSLAYNAFLGPDIVATSWANLQVYERDWGDLGTVEAFRIPGEGADGMVTILPRLLDGGLEVVVGLELGAMGRLLEDSQFLKIARLSG